jgi:Skp family chaperone for outer membrane proteins
VRRTILIAAALLCLPLAACDEAKQAANTAGCKAVDAGVAALSKTDDLSGDGIKKLSDAADTAVTAVESGVTKLPEAAQTKLDDAKKQLDDAVASAETDPEAAKQKVADAAANLSSSLEDAKTSLNC